MMHKTPEQSLGAPGAEREISAELSQRIEEFRNAVIAERTEQMAAWKSRVPAEIFNKKMQDTEMLKTKPAEEFIPRMLNNIHGNLPDGMYRENGKFPSKDKKEIHFAVDAYITQTKSAEIAKRIVQSDKTLDPHEKQDFLAKLYVALRAAGFPHELLTS